jgi:nucleoside-diphosphate-sugar epimerase
MKIFITGTTGFLGRSLKEYYEHGNEIFEYVRGTDVVTQLIVEQPDLIIHCAGEIYDANYMFRTNVVMVEQILEWVRRNPQTQMIQIGSSSEYGPLDRATSELDRINPQNVYEATKGAATLLCQGYARHYNLRLAVARIYSGYGVHERERRLFPTLYRAFFQDEPMTLYAGVHDFIYIDDFVRGIDLLINSAFAPGEIVNFGSGTMTTNLEVLTAWQQVTGRSAPVDYRDEFLRAHDTKFWCCDTGYAYSQLGFKTEYSLEDGIRDFIKNKHEQITTKNN